MPLKPMDKRNGLDTRQAVWDAIRRLGEFTIRQVREETVLRIESVRDYVMGLEAAGYVERRPRGEGRFVAVSFRLIKDIGQEAPRVRRDGSQVTAGQGNENMWHAMRIMRTFTALELAVAARTPDCFVKEASAADYIKHLCHAGYLRANGDGRYRMLPTAYTGPKAPQIQRTKRVWDPNQRKVRWRSDEGGHHDE